MKNASYLLFPIIIFGCSQPLIENDEANGVYVSGKIENPKSDFAIFRAGKGDSKIADTAYLDSAGYFSVLIEITEEGFGYFYHGNERSSMFFVPGDSITLTIDTKEFDETIAYEGSGEAVNNYLAKKYLIKEEMQLTPEELYSLDLLPFLAKIDSSKEALTNNLNKYRAQEPNASPFLIDKEASEILYGWAYKKLNYPNTHISYTGEDSVDLGEEYDNYLAELSLDDSTLFKTIRSYYSFLSEYFEIETNKAINSDSNLRGGIGQLKAKLKIAKVLFETQDIINDFLYRSMKKHIQYEGTANLEETLGEFNNTITNEEYKTKIGELYDQWKFLGEGSEAPAFSYPNIEGDTVNLQDFNGKYIYIDVWATWCGPCRRELPFLEKLQEEYAGKNIVFVSVSIDEEQNSWEQMVAEKEMKGVQLIATKGWKAAICDAYAINSIPRFLLIDREGKIISARAERPSGKIGEVLGSLEDISG